MDFAATNLWYVGQSAFNAALVKPTGGLDVLHLPGSLEVVESYGFGFTFLGAVGTLQFGGPGDPTKLRLMGNNAFQGDSFSHIFGDVVYYVSPTTNLEYLESYKSYIGYTGSTSYPNA